MTPTCPYCSSTNIAPTRSTVQQAGLVRMHCNACQLGHDQVASTAATEGGPAGGETQSSGVLGEVLPELPTATPPTAAASAETALPETGANTSGMSEAPRPDTAGATPPVKKSRNRKK